MRLKAALLLVLILLAACGAGPGQAVVPASAPTPNQQYPGPAAPSVLTVFAAASLTESFTEIAQLFEAQHPGAKVMLNLAGSQQLELQLAEGAPADVFASAATKQMDDAVASRRVEASAVHEFARNRLVVVYPRDNPAKLSDLHDLVQPGLRLILAAKEVPVGGYSQDFLDKASKDSRFPSGFKDAVLRNVVSYEENVKAVLTKVVLGEADAGIVYSTDVTPDAAPRVGRIEIPDELSVIASYPIAIVSDSPQPELANAFVELVLSAQGRDILTRYGFLPASP